MDRVRRQRAARFACESNTGRQLVFIYTCTYGPAYLWMFKA